MILYRFSVIVSSGKNVRASRGGDGRLRCLKARANERFENKGAMQAGLPGWHF